MAEIDGNEFSQRLANILVDLRGETAAGFGGESAEATAARILSVNAELAPPRVDLASNGLSLSQKLFIEKALRSQLGAVGVYFRRAGSGSGPEVRPATSAPFGVKFDRRAIAGVKQVIVVASGKGGVGKSTVSANLAVALAAKGERVGLLDADIYGPSAPMLLGLKGTLSVSPTNQLVPREAWGVKTVSLGFLADAKAPAIWRGPMVSKALQQFCFDVAWGELDYLIIDLPPGTGDVQLTLIERLPLHGAIIVTTPQDVALLDAHKALSMFEKLDVRVLGVVENMAYFHCPNCAHEEAIFGGDGLAQFSRERGLPVLARIPLTSALRAHSDNGEPPGAEPASELGRPFAALAEGLGRALA